MAKIQKNAAIQARRVMAMDRNGDRRRTVSRPPIEYESMDSAT